MKHLKILAAFILSVVSSLAAMAQSPLDVTIEINNPNMAKVEYSYGTDTDYIIKRVNFGTDNSVLVSFPSDSYGRELNISPYITGKPVCVKTVSFYDSEGNQIGEPIRYESTSPISLFVLDTYADGKIKIEMDYVQDYTINATLLGPVYRLVLMVGTTSIDDLEEGEQQIIYKPSDRFIFMQCSDMQSFYYVGFNGVEIPVSVDPNEGKELTYYYSIQNEQITENSNMTVIIVKQEQLPTGISINHPEAVKSVEVDGVEVDNWANNTILTDPNAEITVNFSNEYVIDSCTLNGEEQPIGQSLTFTAEAKQSVVISATPKASGIDTVAVTPAKPKHEGIYSLDGRRLDNIGANRTALPAGLYIIDGAKHLVK